MKQYTVLRKEIHVQPVYVETESEEQAKQLVADGVGDYEESEMYYHSTMDREHWDTEIEELPTGEPKDISIKKPDEIL